jgi:protein-L-isoaspartate O-methyltransferase
VSREDFIPDVIWVRNADGWLVPLSRADDPETWRRLVDSGGSIVTQADDGKLENGKGVIPTSSSSAPKVMRRMLDLLDVEPGMNILEIGTGTGYNAALLAEKAGTGHVTTIEVDPVIADHGRRVLGSTGYPVTVITGDGSLGYAEHAPYDRVMATASALRVPYAWVEQTRPGGRIVLPLVGGFMDSQAFLSLTVDQHGAAHGRFRGAAGFMRLRNQRDDEALWRIWDTRDAQVTTAHLYPDEPFLEFEAGFVLGATLPGWVTGKRTEKDGATILLMSHLASGSWATVTWGSGEYEVRHGGPRRLWEELETAYRWWVDAGRPDHTRFGLSVTPESQTFWLDTPDQIISRQQAARG